VSFKVLSCCWQSAEQSNFYMVKLGVGQGIAYHVLPTVRNYDYQEAWLHKTWYHIFDQELHEEWRREFYQKLCQEVCKKWCQEICFWFLPSSFTQLHFFQLSSSIKWCVLSGLNQTFQSYMTNFNSLRYDFQGWLGVRYEVSSHLSDRLPRTVMGIFSVIYCKMRWGYHAGNRDRKRGLRM